jgi:hypothetical protein
MQINTLIQDIVTIRHISQRPHPCPHNARTSDSFWPISVALWVYHYQIPRAFRGDQSTRGYVDQIPAWDQVDCLKKRKVSNVREFKTKHSPHYEYLATNTVRRNSRRFFGEPHGNTQLSTQCGQTAELQNTC